MNNKTILLSIDLLFTTTFSPVLCPEVHPFLRQVAATAGSAASGALQLASPLQVRAKATQAAVAVWSPTFKAPRHGRVEEREVVLSGGVG